MAHHAAERHPRGFTLIELILVLFVLATAAAIAAPSLGRWGRGSRLRDAGDNFLALSRWARTQAIANSAVYRLNVDAQNGRFWVAVQEGQAFVDVASDFGHDFTMPENTTIEMSSGASQPLEFVTFYPTGRTTAPARVRLADDSGGIDLICETPAEGFRLLKPGETIQ